MPLETVELRFQYAQSEYIKAERQYLILSGSNSPQLCCEEFHHDTEFRET